MSPAWRQPLSKISVTSAAVLNEAGRSFTR
jgi:hypothetical protein